jgi:hypothetical protein
MVDCGNGKTLDEETEKKNNTLQDTNQPASVAMEKPDEYDGVGMWSRERAKS